MRNDSVEGQSPVMWIAVALLSVAILTGVYVFRTGPKPPPMTPDEQAKLEEAISYSARQENHAPVAPPTTRP